MAVLKTLRAGDARKVNPFTICIVANRLLEAPLGSGTFMADPILANQAGFDACADYIVSCLYGSLPKQAEGILNDPAIGPHVRIVSIFDDSPDFQDGDADSLIGQDSGSFILVARRTQIKDYLRAKFGYVVDIAYAVSGSNSHQRASAWFTTDDPENTGVRFTLDGRNFTHCYNSLILGTIAIHYTASSLTAAHEFGHALSSYQNGMIVDLYVDSNPGVNCKRKRPIPAKFGTYTAVAHASDMTRGHLTYPAGWQSFHCERNGSAPGSDLPAIMDDYYHVPAGFEPVQCQHDRITLSFLKDRLAAKIARP